MKNNYTNKTSKNLIFCILSSISILFLLSIFLITNVSALGISPVDKRISFVSNELHNFEFSILSSEGLDLDIGLSAEGDLAKNVLFESEFFTMKASEHQKTIKVGLKLPENLTPGTHTVFIKATPLFQNSGDMVQAFVSPKIPIYIRVPYPSKYAEVRLRVEPSLDANPVPFLLEFDNLGNEDISSAGGSIYVYDQKDDLTSVLNVPKISVSANTYAKSEGSPRPILKKGHYVAKAFAEYDGVTWSDVVNFTVGTPKVVVYGFYTQEVYSGIINPVEFELESDWNSDLQVKAFLEINGVESEVPLIELKPFEKKKISGFLDASSVPLGESEIKLTLVYADQVKSQNFKVSVGDEPPLSFDGKDRTDFIVIISILAFIIVILLIWYYVKKKINSEDQISDSEIGSMSDSSVTKPLNNDEAKEK